MFIPVEVRVVRCWLVVAVDAVCVVCAELSAAAAELVDVVATAVVR